MFAYNLTKGYNVKLTVLTWCQLTTSCYKIWSSNQWRFDEIELSMCYKLIAFCCAQLILLSWREFHQHWFCLIFAVFSVALLLEYTVPKALGFVVPAFGFGKEMAVTGYPKEMYLLFTGCGICFTGDDDFHQEYCTKVFFIQCSASASNSAAVS